MRLITILSYYSRLIQYSYKGVSSAMKTSGWSSKAKKASTAYLAYLTAKKKKPKKPKLWTG